MPNYKIMIVEDDAIIADDLKYCVENLGYSVISIEKNGASAMRRAQIEKPDIIFMDIILEGFVDGIEAASVIYERENIPIIYVTDYSDEKLKTRAKTTKPYDYIIKSFTKQQIQSAIEKALSKKNI